MDLATYGRNTLKRKLGSLILPPPLNMVSGIVCSTNLVRSTTIILRAGEEIECTVHISTMKVMRVMSCLGSGGKERG